MQRHVWWRSPKTKKCWTLAQRRSQESLNPQEGSEPEEKDQDDEDQEDQDMTSLDLLKLPIACTFHGQGVTIGADRIQDLVMIIRNMSEGFLRAMELSHATRWLQLTAAKEVQRNANVTLEREAEALLAILGTKTRSSICQLPTKMLDSPVQYLTYSYKVLFSYYSWCLDTRKKTSSSNILTTFPWFSLPAFKNNQSRVRYDEIQKSLI